MKTSLNKLLLKVAFISCGVFLANIGAAVECDDRNAMAAAMDASERFMNGDSFRRPQVLKRHHPSKRKEVATYFESGDLYYTLFWIVSDDCKAGFIKRTKGKH